MTTRACTPNGAAGRALLLLDVENLLAGTEFSAQEVMALVKMIMRVVPMSEGDPLIVASSHRSAPAAWFGCPANARRLVRSGPDGADRALEGVLLTEHVASRFERVVIGSGDGFFAEHAARLQAAGCAVTVLTRRDALSLRLRLAVRDIRFVDLPLHDPAAAAAGMVA